MAQIESEKSVGQDGLAQDSKIPPRNPKRTAAFTRLPDEIILLILQTCDETSFASLVLLNSKWRRVSQQAHLYAEHLSKCRSYAASHNTLAVPPADTQLSDLRKSFAKEVKRNLFEAYLRPSQTVIKLVSTSISSSSAFPGGEAFHFSFSPNGSYILAYSSSRIYVIYVGGIEVEVKRELKILRRPASVAILDDGSLLAVLSTDHQVDVYDLSKGQARHERALALDNPPRNIALSPTGSVLAAAYDGGVEVYSLSSNAMASDRRGVKCDAVDSLSFSRDGTQLLGTTLHSKNPSTVILTAPYFNPGDHSPDDTVSQLWTTSILFPNSSRDCSHAVLLPGSSDDEASWTFTYDRVFETFRAVRIDDLRNGTTYFTGPISDISSTGKLLPSTLPSVSRQGELVAAGFQGKEIWLYGVPEDLDANPEQNQDVPSEGEQGNMTGTISRKDSGRENAQSRRGSHPISRDTNLARIPQWQILCDKSRNTFVEGRNVSELEGISALKWATIRSGDQSIDRLVATAPGGVGQKSGQLFEGDDDGMAPADGGRILILDFGYGVTDGEISLVTIEVGDKEPEVLEEEHRDMETEVAIVRRRTVAQRGRSGSLAHLATRSATVGRRNVSEPSQDKPYPVSTLPILTPIERTEPSPFAEDQSESVSIDESQELLDAPYAHGAPRSGTTLRRAATAAAVNRRLNPPRVVASEHVEVRRADGREEHPHESDADHWVPPPPPYTKEPIPRVPEHLKNFVPVQLEIASRPLQRSATQRSTNSTDTDILSSLQRSRTTFVPSGRPSLHIQDRTVSEVSVGGGLTTRSADDDTLNDPLNDGHAPIGRGDADFDDLYDVSPQRTPEPERATPVQPPPTPPVLAVLPAAHVTPHTPISTNVNNSNSPVSVTIPSSTNRIPRRPVGANSPGGIVVVSGTESPILQPIPQHIQPESTVQTISEISERQDVAITSTEAQSSNQTAIKKAAHPSSSTQSRLDAPPPPRPNHDHHLTEIPSLSPVNSTDMGYSPPVISEHPPTIHIDTTTPTRAPVREQIPTGPDAPSAAQLARLSTRMGRPPDHVLADPSRRGSGTFTQPSVGSPIRQNNLQYPNIQNNRYSGPPRAAAGAFGSPTQSPTGYHSNSPSQTSPARRLSQNDGRQELSSPQFRPRMSRLETIKSITSQGDDTHIPQVNRRTSTIARQPSRAERSAAINIQDAKRSGWRGTMKKRSPKEQGVGTSAQGELNRKPSVYGKKKSKGERCVVM